MISIPEDKLPEFFKDEARRNVLYAPIRSKTVNPMDWNSKITSWSQLISLYCSSNNVYSFSLESLRAAFKHNGRTPSCLGEVLSQMSISGEIEPIELFMQRKPKTWKEWATNTFVSTPIFWSLNKVKDLVSNPDINVTYVPMKVLEKDGEIILSKMLINYKNKVISLQEFLEMENKNPDKAKDFRILFTSLHKHGKVDIKELEQGGLNECDEFLVKFSDGSRLEPISELDLGIRTLEQNESVLQKNIEILEDNIIECVKEAKIHLSKKHRESAKASLRKKHEIENRLNKKVQALYNVQILLSKLQDSQMDGNIWESYKKAIAAFETTHKKGINEDVVEDTMLKVGEVMEIHSDIQSALARPILNEDAELEEELEQLLNDDNVNNSNNKGSPQKNMDEKLSTDLEKLLLDLPSVPSSPVGGSNKTQDISSKLN